MQKGQTWVYSIILGVVGLVIAAQVLFSQIGSIKSTIGNATLTTSEASLANLTPLVMIAGFLLVALGVFLYFKHE
jgi:uncharacterized membrane protein YdbT with pleckstrin-like domain